MQLINSYMEPCAGNGLVMSYKPFLMTSRFFPEDLNFLNI